MMSLGHRPRSHSHGCQRHSHRPHGCQRHGHWPRCRHRRRRHPSIQTRPFDAPSAAGNTERMDLMLTDLGGDEKDASSVQTNRRYRAAKAGKVYNPCPHGRNSGSQCSHCDREGYQRMTALRNFHRFREQGAWPFGFIVAAPAREVYDQCVAKWTACFAEVLASGRVSADEHAKEHTTSLPPK